MCIILCFFYHIIPFENSIILLTVWTLCYTSTEQYLDLLDRIESVNSKPLSCGSDIVGGGHSYVILSQHWASLRALPVWADGVSCRVQSDTKSD